MHASNGNIRGTYSSAKRNLSLKFGHLNIRGALRGKSAEVDLILQKQHLHILGISESNQLEGDYIQINDKNYYFEPGFNYTEKKTRIGAYIHKSLSYKVRRDIMTKLLIPCVWLDIKVGNVKIAVLNIYREHKLYLPKPRII